jgi:hypothetical protein
MTEAFLQSIPENAAELRDLYGRARAMTGRDKSLIVSRPFHYGEQGGIGFVMGRPGKGSHLVVYSPDKRSYIFKSKDGQHKLTEAGSAPTSRRMAAHLGLD